MSSTWLALCVGSYRTVAIVLATVCAISVLPDAVEASDPPSGEGSSVASFSRSVSSSANGKTVSITETSDSGITVTITELVDGKEKKSVVQAASAEELKKKDADAYRIYEQHSLRAKSKVPFESHRKRPAKREVRQQSTQCLEYTRPTSFPDSASSQKDLPRV